MGFPRYKSRNHDSQTGIVFTTSGLRLEADARHFTLPRIGTVRLAERLTIVRSLLKRGGTLGNVTVSNSQGRWWISINVRVSDALALQYFNQKHKRRANKQVGLDVGLKVFLADSEGNVVENPQYLRKSLAKLRKANKRLSRRRALNRRTGEVASKRWERVREQVVKAHAKIADQRSDFLHKLSTKLVLENKLIGVEDLNVKGMVRNRHLSLSISDASWGELKRQLKYKAAWYDSEIVEVDRFFPSTKKCSKCGSVKAKLTLSERTYKCEQCNLVMDRDENAARTIKQEAVRIHKQQKVAQSCGETQNGRGDGSSGLVLAPSETTVEEATSSTKVLQPA